MYKAELELEKRLNDLALANVPSGSAENIVIVPKRKPQVFLEMSPDEFDLRDLAYDQKMNVISSNAIVDRLGWKPSKIKSDVTKAMIEDYQIELMKDMSKRGVYIPSSLDLDLLELPDPPETFTPAGMKIVERNLKAIGTRMTAIQNELSALPRAFQEHKDNVYLELNERLTEMDSVVYKNPTQRLREKGQLRREYEDAIARMIPDFEAYLVELQTEYDTLAANSAQMDQDLRDQDANLSKYRQELAEVTQENEKRRKAYEDQVRLMNTGVNNIAMLPNETQLEYEERMKDIGASSVNLDAVQASAGLLYTDRLRKRMAEITRDDVLVGDFIRRLNPEERYSIEKVFDTFKKKVLEVFGENNKNMSADDLFNIASVFADEVAIKAVNEPPLYKKADARPVGEVFEAFAVEEGSVLPPRIPEEPSRVDLGASRKYEFSDEVTKSLPAGRRSALLKYSQGQPLKSVSSFSGAKQPESVDRIYLEEARRIDAWKTGSLAPSRTEPDISRFFAPPREEIPFEDLRIGVRALSEEQADEDEKRRLLDLLTYSEPDLRRALRLSGLLEAVSARRGTTGRGLHSKYPKLLRFGLIELSPHKLFYENTLKITRKGKHLTGFPNVKVSDNFVRFMFKIMDGGQPTMKEVNSLSTGEKALFDSVIFTAGLAREVETTGSGVKQDLKNRLSLIEGEIEAGNTNPELIKEARKILQHLARMKIIGHRPATEHLKMLIRAQRE